MTYVRFIVYLRVSTGINHNEEIEGYSNAYHLAPF